VAFAGGVDIADSDGAGYRIEANVVVMGGGLVIVPDAGGTATPMS